MVDPEKQILAQRVQESAEALSRLATSSLNFPLTDYIAMADVSALFDSLTLAPDSWNEDDLKRILIIRDGLFDITNQLSDKNGDSIHSIEQLINAFSRLYVDLERLLKTFNLAATRQALEMGRHSPVASPQILSDANQIIEISSEVTTEARITSRYIELNLLKIENVNIDLFRQVNLTIKRFSATAFAVKINLETRVIFQGIFNFLSTSADRILDELKNFSTSLKKAYQNLTEFNQHLEALVKIGGRFSSLVSHFLRSAFEGGDATKEVHVTFQSQKYSSGQPLFCGALTKDNAVTFGGRIGYILQVGSSSTRNIAEQRNGRDNINALVSVQERYIALGTESGLDLIGEIGSPSQRFQAAYNENIATVVAAPWGGLGVALITGSRDGYIRRYSLRGGLSRYSQQGDRKLGRNIKKIVLIDGERLAVACGEHVIILDSELRTISTIDARMAVRDLCVFDQSTLLACGPGRVGAINLASGSYTRMTSDAPEEKYSAICKLSEISYCTATEDGRVAAAELASGVEIGYLETDMHIRGLVVSGQRIFAYGGPTNSSNTKNLAIILWDQQIGS